MFYHSTTKSKPGSTKRVVPNDQQLIILPKTILRENSLEVDQHSKFTAALLSANPDIDLNKVQNEIYFGVLGYSTADLRAVLRVPPEAPSPRPYISQIGLGRVICAEEAIRIHITAAESVIPISVINEIIGFIVRSEGGQARAMARYLNVNIATGQSLTRR